MKKMIFHLPYEPDSKRFSASQIRPFKMIKGFEEIGYEVNLVMGNAQKRKKQIAMIKKQIALGQRFDFLYAESSTMPTLLTETHHFPTYPFLDFNFFKLLKSHRIPVGLFYRDIHWRFEQYQIGALKKWITSYFYRYDLEKYHKLVDILFLPSLEMKSFIPELKGIETVALPPGCEPHEIETPISPQKPSQIRLLYVGGLGALYNLEMILEAIHSFTKDQFVLTICTRKEDLKAVEINYEKYFKSDQVHWVHQGGSDLKNLYSRHDICCLFVKPLPYWEFAMPVKLFEYISFQKPVLAVKNTAAGNFVAKKQIGWAINYQKNEIHQFLVQLLVEGIEDRSKVLFQQAQENSWTSRAKEVVKSLIK
jgi:glycosyltransferase involved in cell wall biosynthesis